MTWLSLNGRISLDSLHFPSVPKSWTQKRMSDDTENKHTQEEILDSLFVMDKKRPFFGWLSKRHSRILFFPLRHWHAKTVNTFLSLALCLNKKVGKTTRWNITQWRRHDTLTTNLEGRVCVCVALVCSKRTTWTTTQRVPLSPDVIRSNSSAKKKRNWKSLRVTHCDHSFVLYIVGTCIIF